MSIANFTGIDLMIVAIVLTMSVLGYRRGFIVGALSLVGLAVGAVIGTRIGPLVLDGGARSPYNPLFGLLGAGLAGTVLASGLEGVGRKLRRNVGGRPAAQAVDGALGSALSLFVGFGMVWITSAALMHAPASRSIRPMLQGSVIVRTLAESLPASGPILNSLSRYDPLPAFRGPDVLVAAPEPVLPSDPELRAAARSVVRVVGTSCGLGVTGSGWVGRRGLVVTNAHVVAGQRDTTVQVGGRPPDLEAQVVFFDAGNDLAVLRVPDLDRPALHLVDRPVVGVSGAIMGYPESGPFVIRGARLGEAQRVSSQDIYGRDDIERQVVLFRGPVRHGNSGGPVVGGDGRVLTTVFGGTIGGRRRGGYGVPNLLVQRALQRANGPVDSGGCIG